MKLIYTEQALLSLEEALNFIAPKVTHEKLICSFDKYHQGSISPPSL
jgi:hypothetical protein